VRTAWIVAARDLRAMVRGWLAWVLIAGALLVEGLYFYAFGLGAEGAKLSGDVLLRFFDGASATAIAVALVLGMRSFAAERERGTLVLLTTAPVPTRDLVLGKLLAGLVVLAALQAGSLHMPALVLVHGRVAPAHVAIGYLGVMLLGGACLAIGIFASTLARSQAVAAVVAAVIVGALLLAWMVARTAEPPWSDGLAAIALHHAHQRPFMRGVLRLEHVVYYVGVVVTSQLAAARALHARRWT